jgi:hypothetical protein
MINHSARGAKAAVYTQKMPHELLKLGIGVRGK